MIEWEHNLTSVEFFAVVVVVVVVVVINHLETGYCTVKYQLIHYTVCIRDLG